MVWSFVALARRVTRFGRRMQEIYREATGGAAAGSGEGKTRHRGRHNSKTDYAQQRPRKKIDKNVGEYVEFEETTEKIQTPQATVTTTEQQVVDVEWEDLPK